MDTLGVLASLGARDPGSGQRYREHHYLRASPEAEAAWGAHGGRFSLLCRRSAAARAGRLHGTPVRELLSAAPGRTKGAERVAARLAGNEGISRCDDAVDVCALQPWIA